MLGHSAMKCYRRRAICEERGTLLTIAIVILWFTEILVGRAFILRCNIIDIQIARTLSEDLSFALRLMRLSRGEDGFSIKNMQAKGRYYHLYDIQLAARYFIELVHST